MFRVRTIALLLLGVLGCEKTPPAKPKPAVVDKVAKLTSVGPRVIANDAAYPLYLYGENFVDGMKLRVEGDAFEVKRISDTLASTTVSNIELPSSESILTLKATLLEGDQTRGEAALKVVNDADYPWPYDLEVIDGAVFVASPTTDTVWRYDTEGTPTAFTVRDRPRALAEYRDDSGKRFVVVVGELNGMLTLLDAETGGIAGTIAVRGQPQDIVVDGAIAYVSDRVSDTVHVVDLHRRHVVADWYAGINPRRMAVGLERLAVSNLGGDELVILSRQDGSRTEVVVGPGAKIIGGHTEKFSDYVMGLKAPRDLVWSEKHEVFLAATLGPNIGPNPDRMEVSMNSGVSVIAADGTFRHHVSMRRGNAERIAVDDDLGVILAADIARGRVVAFDLAAVVKGRGKMLTAQLFVEPPETVHPMRPLKEYGVDGHPTTSMYSGPAAIEIHDGRAYVLNRFTGTVSVVDYKGAKRGRLEIERTLAAPDMGSQSKRREGEVVFTTDFGDSRMTCDTCHHEGHNAGTLFTKGNPMHIYRSPSLRSISETAPYFTPAKFPSLAKISHFVTARNRLQNLPPNTREVEALVEFQRALAPPPNPYLGQKEIKLTGTRRGRPVKGANVFEANCASCHPPPMFTPDQDAETRGKTHETGEVTIALRPEHQDATPYPVPVPTLVGVWDNHPLFHGGQVGSKVVDKRIVPTRFALDEVLDKANHFDASGLTDAQRNDLLAYLLTL